MFCISCDHPCGDTWHDEYGEAMCEHCARAEGIEATADADDAAAPVETESNRILARWLRHKAAAAAAAK